MPWDGEHHAAIASARDHKRGIARKKAPVQNDVSALAGSNHRSRSGFVHPAKRVAKYAGGIDNDFGRELKILARLEVTHRDLLFLQGSHWRVVCDDCAVVGGRAGERDGEAGIVELAV